MSATIPTGNTFDKYGSANPVVRRLMDGFEGALEELLILAAPSSVLDVGCGEGVLTERYARRAGVGRVVGLDLPDERLAEHWASRRHPRLRFVAGRADQLEYATGEFDLVCATEVLEHLADPGRALGEMARVAERHLIVSTPREPLWRILNLARGAYLRRLGNTPGHIGHFSRRGLLGLLSPHGEVLEVRTPPPWTIALVAVR
jgi:2-polyprenyl-3-methyl-5-hydroxy-6-metoxy-1,4-benzoquinol methylase